MHIKQVNSNALTMQNIGWAKCIAPLHMLVTYGTSTNFCIVLYCIVMHLQFHFEESAFDQLDEDRLSKLKKDAIPCVIAECLPKRQRFSTNNDVRSQKCDSQIC